MLDQRMTTLEVAVAALSATIMTKLDLMMAQGRPWAADVEARLRLLEQHVDPTNIDHEARLRLLEQHDDPTDADHEARIRRLERTVWIAAGAASAAGGALGAWVSAVMGV